MESFYSNGKLLLTGEYAVLDGALALAVPTRYGQSLSVEESDSPGLSWKSRDENGKVWFEGNFEMDNLRLDGTPPDNNPTAETLFEIVREAKKLNPGFFGDGVGFQIETKLSFPRNWGLGSSSTLINNIAQWAEVDAFELLNNSFSGSGYDIACAQRDRPISYRLKNRQRQSEKAEISNPAGLITALQNNSFDRPDAEIKEVDFNPSFKDKLYFVHLNKKQNSREGIAAYRKVDVDRPLLVKRISEITRKTVSCENLEEFESLMTKHERILSEVLRMPAVKKSLFPDFEGAIKSLGAWGGDFVLVTGNHETPDYFKKLGYGTVIRFAEMVLGAKV